MQDLWRRDDAGCNEMRLASGGPDRALRAPSSMRRLQLILVLADMSHGPSGRKAIHDALWSTAGDARFSAGQRCARALAIAGSGATGPSPQRDALSKRALVGG